MFSFSKVSKIQSKSLVSLRLNHFKAKYLERCEANYTPLSPLSPFKRTVKLYPNKLAYVYGNTSRTWGEVGVRASLYASALRKLGISKGDVVSIISPNTPAIYESHFAVPGAEAVLHTINTRLDATTIAFQLNHSQAKIVLVDSEFNDLLIEVREIMDEKGHKVPIFISIVDPEFAESKETAQPLIGSIEFEDFLRTGDATFPLIHPTDEFDALTLNYTSGLLFFLLLGSEFAMSLL
jgi:fatty-acyl-CoA synthase